jgi:hypothetical protein
MQKGAQILDLIGMELRLYQIEKLPLFNLISFFYWTVFIPRILVVIHVLGLNVCTSYHSTCMYQRQYFTLQYSISYKKFYCSTITWYLCKYMYNNVCAVINIVYWKFHWRGSKIIHDDGMTLEATLSTIYISSTALLTECCVMDQSSEHFQSLISFTKYLRDIKEEINVNNCLPQGSMLRPLSLCS